MEKGNTGKYVKYAIGEIILVVIGILIALQINSWNQERLERLEERVIIENIHEEFIQNRAALERVLAANNECHEAGLIIMDLIGKSEDSLRLVNTDSLIYKSVEFENFNPSENAISDLIQSGRLQVLKNKELKDLIHEWSRIMKAAIDNFEGFDSKVEDDLVPYLTRNYPFKDIDYYGPLKWKSKSVLPNNKLKIFQDMEYESLVDDTLYRLITYMDDLNDAKAVIDKIIEETK